VNQQHCQHCGTTTVVGNGHGCWLTSSEEDRSDSERIGVESVLQHTRARRLTDCEVAYMCKRIRVSSGDCDSLFPVGNNKGRKLQKTLYRTLRVSVILKMFEKNERVMEISSCSLDSKFKCSVETSRL
jgi:hypothetical protein